MMKKLLFLSLFALCILCFTTNVFADLGDIVVDENGDEWIIVGGGVADFDTDIELEDSRSCDSVPGLNCYEKPCTYGSNCKVCLCHAWGSGSISVAVKLKTGAATKVYPCYGYKNNLNSNIECNYYTYGNFANYSSTVSFSPVNTWTHRPGFELGLKYYRDTEDVDAK